MADSSRGHRRVRSTGHWILCSKRRVPAVEVRTRKGIELEVGKRLTSEKTPEVLEARRHPRYQLEVDIRVYPRNSEVAHGYTVDISESGISAMLREEVPLGEVVRLEFSLPAGDVEIHAMVRQRNAFRYGFQFVEASSAQDLIGVTCRQLSVQRGVSKQNSQ